MAERNWIEVVLTGGPSGGKSSSLAYLTDKLNERGVRVLAIPEIPTFVVLGGISDMGAIAAAEDRSTFLAIEEQFLVMQQAVRHSYRRLAEAFAPQSVVILADRADMDVMSYVGAEHFNVLLRKHDLTLHDVRDSYDAVIHLVSAAKGAAEFYTKANNQARRETAEEAVDADDRTLQAWVGHPHLWIIDNSTDFDGKLRRVLDAVLHTMGEPHGVEIERKFLLGRAPDLNHPTLAAAVAIDIEQTYLLSDDRSVERRLRKRSQDGQTTYFYTEKSDLPGGHRQETEARISASEYDRLIRDADPALRPISKRRLCFAHAGHHCELDFIPRADGSVLHLLEIELLSDDAPVQLPDFLGELVEVTDDRAYRNHALAAA